MKKIFSIIRYYTPAEYLLIILIGIASNLSLRYYPLLIDYPKIVEWFHEVLNLPGPGGGIFLPTGIYLFWAFLLYGLTGKKGAIFFMTLIMLIMTAIQSPFFSGKNAFWNIGLIVISISCEIFTVLFKDRKAPGRIMPAVLVVLAAACVVQILLGVKIWAKSEMWPGAVPVFIAAGFIIAFIMLIKKIPHTVTAGMMAITIYIVYLWLTVFFPPFKPPVGYPLIIITVQVSAAVFVLAAAGLTALLKLILKKMMLKIIENGFVYGTRSYRG